jgi:hypothetical protein
MPSRAIAGSSLCAIPFQVANIEFMLDSGEYDHGMGIHPRMNLGLVN